MSREQKKLYVRITADCIVGGRTHAPGELLAVEAGVYRQLLADALAVPTAAPLAAAKSTDKIRPFDEETA